MDQVIPFDWELSPSSHNTPNIGSLAVVSCKNGKKIYKRASDSWDGRAGWLCTQKVLHSNPAISSSMTLDEPHLTCCLAAISYRYKNTFKGHSTVSLGKGKRDLDTHQHPNLSQATLVHEGSLRLLPEELSDMNHDPVQDLQAAPVYLLPTAVLGCHHVFMLRVLMTHNNMLSNSFISPFNPWSNPNNVSHDPPNYHLCGQPHTCSR